MRTPDPGIYRGIEPDIYHGWDAVRYSNLKLFDRTPMHARYEMLHPSEDKSAYNVGSATHGSIYEPERFATDFVVAPKLDRRTKVGKQKWAEFQEAAAGKTILTAEEHELAAELGAAVHRHPFAAQLLAKAQHVELAVVWIDPTTELKCKAKIDMISSVGGFTWIGDLKTCRDASPRGFGRAIAQFDYDLQAFMYTAGLNEVSPYDRRFCFIAAEKEPPFAVAVYELTPEDMKVGGEKFSRCQWKACMDTNTWPGYGAGLQTPIIPGWNHRDFDEESLY